MSGCAIKAFEGALLKSEKSLAQWSEREGAAIRSFQPFQVRETLDADPEECARLVQNAIENMLWGATYFVQFPNPTNNLLVGKVCQRLAARKMNGVRVREKEPDLTGAFARGGFLPLVSSPTRGIGAENRWTLREILGEEREAICQQAEQGILGECEIEVALTIIDAMADEMSFYDELRESLNEAIEADQALEYFRRLIPIWVAKQDQNLQWSAVGERGEARLDPSWRMTQKSFFGSPLFLSPRWIGAPESKRSVAEALVEPIVEKSRRDAGENPDPGWGSYQETVIENYTRMMQREWDEYTALADEGRDAGARFAGIGDDLRNRSVRSLFGSFESDANGELFPDALKHKANFVFGLYVGALLGPLHGMRCPFPEAEGALFASASGTREVGPENLRPEGQEIRESYGPVALSIGFNPLGDPRPNQVVFDPMLSEGRQAGMIAAVAGRAPDIEKWDDLRAELKEVIKSCVSPGSSSFERVLTLLLDGFLDRSAKIVEGFFRDGIKTGNPFAVVGGIRVTRSNNVDDSGSAIVVREEGGCSERASDLVEEWKKEAARIVSSKYEAFAEREEECLSLRKLESCAKAIRDEFYEVCGLECLVDFSAGRASESSGVGLSFRKDDYYALFAGGDGGVIGIVDHFTSVGRRIAEVKAGDHAIRLTEMACRSEGDDEPHFASERWRQGELSWTEKVKGLIVGPAVVKQTLSARIDQCVGDFVSGCFSGNGAEVYRKTLMDFIWAGFVDWASGRRGFSGDALAVCIGISLDRFAAYERDASLCFGPSDLDVCAQIDAGMLTKDEYERGGVPGNRHLLFYYEEWKRKLVLACMDKHNGALLSQAGLTGKDIFMISGECTPGKLQRKADLAAKMFGAVQPEICTDSCPLHRGDRIYVPVQFGLTISVS